MQYQHYHQHKYQHYHQHNYQHYHYTMHYLEGPFDSALGKIVAYLVPDHPYKSVHDFFNPRLFHSTLTAILQNIPDFGPHLDQLLITASIEQSQSLGTTGFVQLRTKNFKALWHAMQMALNWQGQDVGQLQKEHLFRMVKQYDLDILQTFLQHLFELLIKHHGALEYITELQGDDQTAIKDFLQKAKDKAQLTKVEKAVKQQEEDDRRSIQEENVELRHLVNSKETDLQRIALEKLQLEDQITELREFQTLKENQIDSLKKRLMAYEQTDTLFQQKDEQIHKLNKTVTQLQLANRLLTSDLTAQKIKFQSKISELQQINGQYQLKVDKFTASLELVAKQKEQIQGSNKKVIANLKQKIKSQTDRMAEFQNQLVQAKISRQLRQRQFNELWTNYQSLRSQSLNESVNKIPNSVKRFSSGEMEGGLLQSGQHKEFLRLGEEISQLQKLHQNAFEEEIMMFESGQDNLKKVQQIINQNTRLKERLTALDSKDYRAVMQQNEKLKKRMTVMKKRNQELETQKRQELELMVSAFEHCLRTKE